MDHYRDIRIEISQIQVNKFYYYFYYGGSQQDFNQLINWYTISNLKRNVLHTITGGTTAMALKDTMYAQCKLDLIV